MKRDSSFLLVLLLLVTLSACSETRKYSKIEEDAKKPAEPAIPPEYQEELAALNQVVESYHHDPLPVIDAKHANTHTRLGVIYFNIGNMEKARYNLERSINMFLKNPKAHLYLGRVFSKLDRYHEAVNEFDLALKINPDLAEVYKDLGDLYRKMGMEKESTNAFQEYESARPGGDPIPPGNDSVE